jgi:hypothetical protein
MTPAILLVLTLAAPDFKPDQSKLPVAPRREPKSGGEVKKAPLKPRLAGMNPLEANPRDSHV